MVIAKGAPSKSKKRIAAEKVTATTTKNARQARKATSGSKASDLVDQQLARYRSMRDFSITSEPGGGSSKGQKRSSVRKVPAGLPFVIQKHAASHLHYD